MRCRSCDHPLSNSEATNLYASTGEHVDLCTPCTKAAGIQVVKNPAVREVVEDDTQEYDDHYHELLNDAPGG